MSEAPVLLSEPDYQSLAGVLQAALDHAATGKGNERHGNGRPFLEQPTIEIGRLLQSEVGPMQQVMKKVVEARFMILRGQHDAAVSELLGAINYAAAAILLVREI